MMKMALNLPLGGGGVLSRPERLGLPKANPPPARRLHLAPLVRPFTGLKLATRLEASAGQAMQTQTKEDAMRWLAARVTAECKGFGSSEDEVLRALKNRGIECSYVKNRKRLFRVPGESIQVYASEVIRSLQEELENPSSNGRPAAPVSYSAPATSYSAPAASYSAPAASAGSASGLEGLAAWISTNYLGMGKSAADALPELRRKGITASGNSFMMSGQRMDAAGIANALRLQARTPSRSSTPEPVRPSASSAPAASYSAPAASAGSATGLEGLAAWISTNYMGMGKSAADALPELRRKGITASGNSFMMGGQRMDAAGIANALRLQARTPSRPSTPEPVRPAASSAPAASYSAPAASASSASGLEGLAAWISANYMGMGKSAADALPELRRKGITGSGNSFVMGGQRMSPAEVASALRLEPRKDSRPSSPVRRQMSPPPRAPSPPPPTTFGAKAGGPSELSPTEAIKAGTEWLAAWISAHYVGMGKSAADALPELRRRGVVCTYVKDGHHLFRFPGEPTQVDAPQVAKMLQLRPR